jgi:outer membrane protein assembly factor BamB
MMMNPRAALSLTFGLFLTSAALAENWPQWRGVDGQGHATSATVPVMLGTEDPLKWQRALPGRGYSSPVIWGDQIWVTTAIEKEASAAEAEKRLKANTGDQPVTVLASASLRAVCIDKTSGEITQDVELLVVKDPQWVHELNSYASPTPIVEDGRLYCHFGAFGTACLDTATGSPLWRNTDHFIMHENGPGGSPALHENLLIFHCDGSDKQYVTAIDKVSGKTVWKTERSGKLRPNPQQKKAYGTPLIVDMNGQPTVVSTGADWIYGYEPKTGKELWKVSYGQLGFSMSPRPIVGHGMIFFSTSFSPPTMFALKYEGLKTPEIVWSNKKNAPSIPSPLLVGEELYFLNDGGILSCVEAKTGTEIYRERLGGKFTSSLTYAAGHLYACSREGVVSVVKVGKEFKIAATHQVEGGIYSSPAIVDGSLFLRTDKALLRFDAAK